MRKYRIRIETRADGHKVYYPEIKGRLWGWNALKEHTTCDSYVMEFYCIEDAQQAINISIREYMRERVEKIEARYL